MISQKKVAVEKSDMKQLKKYTVRTGAQDLTNTRKKLQMYKSKRERDLFLKESMTLQTQCYIIKKDILKESRK